MATRKSTSESYIHYYAKQVLMQWLRASKGKFFSMRWNPYGDQIYDEYPIILVDNKPTHGPYDEVWAQIPSKICTCPVVYSDLLLTSAINPCRHHLTRDDNIPSREESIVYGFKVGAVVDVAVVDEGRLKYIFEIVHTNPVSPMKRKLLLAYAAKFDAVIYEVDSDYVLRQVCFPDKWRGVKMGVDEKVVRRFRRRWKGKKAK
jgi:hypothetical protein